MTALRAIWKNQVRLTAVSPWFLLVLLLMPMFVMPVLKNTMALSLSAQGFGSANGAEQVVPGQAVTFGLFVASTMAFQVFQEHTWETWDRLRAANTPRWAFTLGFAAPWFVVTIIYQLMLFAAGVLFLDLNLSGAWLELLLVMMCLAAAFQGLVVLLTAALPSIQLIQALVYVGGIAFGALGGGLVPFENLPDLAQRIGPALPSYWAMRAFRSLLLADEGLSEVLLPCGVLLAFAAVFFGLGSARFNESETKLGFG